MKKLTEAQEHSQLCEYLRVQYPNIMFNTDMSGIKLSMGMAIKASKLRSHRGMPDLFIIEPRLGYSGLFIELKRTGEKVYKMDGSTPTSKHVEEQIAVQHLLLKMGFSAGFGLGFEHAKEVIDNYLK